MREEDAQASAEHSFSARIALNRELRLGEYQLSVGNSESFAVIIVNNQLIKLVGL